MERFDQRDDFILVSSKPVVYPRVIFRKSTFFNVLTKSAAAAENFPFCTIGQCIK